MSSCRRRTSLHLQYVCGVRLSFTDCISTFYIRDIARALRGKVDGSCTHWKFGLSDWARMKFEGVRYVDQDGILTDEGGVGIVESGINHTSMGDTALWLVNTGMVWDGEQEPTATGEVGFGSEGVSTDNRHFTQAVELLPADFFADPSVLFSGPSSTGFTGIGDQRIAGAAAPYIFRNLWSA